VSTSRKKSVTGVILLFAAAILWGSCFIFQKMGMVYIGPYTLGAFRFIIGGLVLLPVIFVFSKMKSRSTSSQTAIHSVSPANDTADKQRRKTLWTGGILCGTVLFLAATCQQMGLLYTTTGKAAFLTAMEIVAVEIITIILFKRIRIKSVIGTAVAIIGMYLLCIKSGFSMQSGDILELIGAMFWGFQIIFIGKYSKTTDVMKLSLIEFMTAGVLSALCMFIFEKPDLTSIYAAAIPIAYTAVIEVALCYTLQIIGQKYVAPNASAVILSLESVFAAIFGAIFINEMVTGREIGGMFLMLLAVVIILMPFASVIAKIKTSLRRS
jgi:drug/metabolite transporter (DMT)-like permease